MVLSPKELLALSSTPTTVESTSTLFALGSQPAPFSQGLTAADYEKLHEAHGEPFRYWDAFTAPGVNRNAKQYVEQPMADEARGLFYQSKFDVESEQWGMIPTGSTMFSCLPDVCEIIGTGYLLRTAIPQWRLGKAVITRGSTDTDALPERFVRQIVKVVVNGTSVNLATVDHVSADSPNDGDYGGLKWLSGAPAAGTSYFVMFRYSPLYACLSEQISGEPIGADGRRLPQRVFLRSATGEG